MTTLIITILLVLLILTICPAIFATIIFRTKNTWGTRFFFISTTTVALLSIIGFALSALEHLAPNFEMSLSLYWITEFGMWLGIIISACALIEVCKTFASLGQQAQSLEQEINRLTKINTHST